MYLSVKPLFVCAISWLPPTAPAACGWILQCETSIINHSISGSSISCSRIYSQRPPSHQRLNRLWILPIFPCSGGISLHGAPFSKSTKHRWWMSDCRSHCYRPTSIGRWLAPTSPMFRQIYRACAADFPYIPSFLGVYLDFSSNYIYNQYLASTLSSELGLNMYRHSSKTAISKFASRSE